MRTAMYARVSTKDGRQDTENQLRQLRSSQLVRNGQSSTNTWIRHPESVRTANNSRRCSRPLPAVNSTSCCSGSLDRLSREGTVETLNHLQRLTSYGVNYRSFTEQYLDSTGIFKEAVIGILAAVAKQERIRLSERTLAGLERARAQGRVGGRPKTEGNLKVTNELLRMRKQGKSIRQIAAALSLSTNTVLKVMRHAA